MKKSALMGFAFAICLSLGAVSCAKEAPSDRFLSEEESEPMTEETEAPQTESPPPGPPAEEQTEGQLPDTSEEGFDTGEEAEAADTEITDTELSDVEEEEASWEDGTAGELEEESESERESEEEDLLAEEDLSTEEDLLPVERSGASAAISGTNPQEDPTLHQIEDEEEVAESIEGFSIDISSYPAADASANTRYIYRYLTEEMGLNHAAACGVLANIQLESGFNQYALGDNGNSYGICQWHNERFNRLISYCGSRGLDYNTLDGQLAYLSYELAASYPNVLSYLLGVENTADGAYDAGYYWCVYFESPSDTAARAAQRGNLAKNEYYPLDLSMPETLPEETEIEEAEAEETTVEGTVPEEAPGEAAAVEEPEAEENLPEEAAKENRKRVLHIRKRIEKALARSAAEEEEDNRQAVADLRRLLDERKD